MPRRGLLAAPETFRVAAASDQLEAVPGHVVTAFALGVSRDRGKHALELGRRIKILDSPADLAKGMVVVPCELFGEPEAAVIPGSSDALEDADVDQRGDVPVGAAVGDFRHRVEYFGDRERPSRVIQRLDYCPKRPRIAVIGA
jgi:hypothetical protein